MFETLTQIRTLLKDRFQSQFKTFMIDNPALIPESALPCLAIVPVSTDTILADTGRDIHTHTIEIRLIINAVTEVQGKRDQMIGTQFLTETMEKKDSDGKLKSNTILGVLREDLKLGRNWYIGNDATVEYTIEERGEQFFTKEAVLRITIQRVSNR